jgi:hypothetical protein
MAKATVSKQPKSSNVDDREDFKNPKKAIPRLARQAVDAGATLKEVAAVLKTDEASVGKILGITPQDATKIEFFVKPGDEFDTDFDKTPSMFKQVVDRARYALESRELPDVSVDKPDVTLTDLMAQSKPSLPSVSIPERPSVAKPDTTLAPVRKEISPMGTYGMTREEFEAARGPRIGDVKRSDIGGVLKDVDISESLKAKINAFAELNQRLSEVSKPDVVEQEDAMAGLSDSLKEKVNAYRNSKSEEGIGVLREIAGGLSLQTADELEALYASKVNDTSYSVEKDRINREREEFSYLNPGAAVAAETVGIIPSAFLSTALLTRAGIVSLPKQGAIEAGTYGFASGESAEERLILGSTSALVGGSVGKIIDSVFNPNLVKTSTNPDTLHTQQVDALQTAVSGQKITRPTAELTDDDLVDQLIIRETEFLADAVGRQGTDPNALGNTMLRLMRYAEEMGVSGKQAAKVVGKNKRVKQLIKDSNRGFDDVTQLNAFREDLLDLAAGRLSIDKGRTIPEAQSSIVKFRRFASPLATLAETVVGPAFSSRIIRGMNRVVRGQSELDEMWKGMEGLRNLADDVKFNDLMLDAVNATNIGAKAAAKSLQAAKKYADAKIGKGAGERLQKFFDDNVEFNGRYRKEVTAGVLSDVWLHSALKYVDDDVSLRINRARAAGKAEDVASKKRSRKSMEEERAKLDGDELEYANIFDSHWRWQRETLTRMELGKQLGFRTSGMPTVALDVDKLPKRLRKKVKKGEMTALEATAKLESDSFKLFDEKIIREAMEREGLSDLQIKNAIEILDDLGVNANRGMSQELEVVRSLGYVGTIANPYGALMNVHDLFNAAFELGVGNVLKSVFGKNNIRLSADDVGLARQVFGEFIRRSTKGDSSITGVKFLEKLAKGSEDLLEWSMKASGFSGLDKFGKTKIMGASFNKAKQDMARGSFDSKWANTFSKAELDQLKRDIAAGDTNSELVRDLVMFDLFRLQPINPAAQTSAGLKTPNARIFYMLKGFAVKQLDLMERRIFREWQQGNKKEALNNAMKYLVISGGGFGVVNEGRQVLKGEAPNPEEAAVGALYQIGSVLTLGAMGANDYGYTKFMQDPANAMLTNIFPPVSATLPAAVLKDMGEAATKGDPLPDETIYALPVVGKTLKGVFD